MIGLVLILGLGEPASVAALVLHRAGYRVALASDAAPRAHRRGMCFADAWWDGAAPLDGVRARICDPGLPPAQGAIPIYRLSARAAVQSLPVSALIDARLAKRDRPPDFRALAPLTIGCGPGHVAGPGPKATCHVAIETGWGPDLTWAFLCQRLIFGYMMVLRLFMDPRPEPECMTRPGSGHDQPHIRSRRRPLGLSARSRIPLAAGWARADETNLEHGSCQTRVRPGSSTRIRRG